MKALILENSRLYRQLLDNILGQQGFENDITDEISIAKDFLQQNHYDVICLNENLKDGSGLELAQICSDDPKCDNTPILLFTSDKNIRHKIGDLQFAEIIFKQNLQQISDQIILFLENTLDPVFSEGKILFVEDSLSVSQLIYSALSDTGFQVEHYSSAEQAWQSFKDEISYGSDKEAFDLILTDINLEGEMSGTELVHKVRQLQDARGHIPIIASTAQTDDALRLKLYREGISDFLPKPVLIEELLLRVKNLITNKRLLDKVHDQRRELYAMATTDKLTGCHNRHSLTDFAKKFISQAIRHLYPISLIMLDLDHFKKINDTHGHAVGDIVLSELGQLLNSSFRDGDMVARFGGEEFVVLMNHCNIENALIKAEKLRQHIEKLQPNNLTVTSSIGVTSLEIGMQFNFEALFHAADLGVYKAKESGRNQVQFIDAGTE
jgi:two-component system cell cycle response regulator